MTTRPNPDETVGSAYPPPQTGRPRTELVTALESDPTGRAMLARCRGLLGPGEWAVDTDSGFWWVPHRLRHSVELVEQQDAMALRSSFTLVEQIDDPAAAVRFCNSLNQRPFGAVAWFDPDRRCIELSTCVRLNPATWFETFVFELTVLRLVGIAERFAVCGADRCGGTVPTTEHPTRGLRRVPDQLVDEVDLVALVPESAIGLWWSRAEVRGFRGAIRFALATRGDESQAALLDPDVYDDTRLSAANMALSTVVPTELGASWLSVDETLHPDVGRVTEILHVSPVCFDAAAVDGVDSSIPLAEVVANEINRWSVTAPAGSLLCSGVSARDGQLARSTVLFPEVLRMLQSTAAGWVGEVLGVIVSHQLDLHRLVVDVVRSTGAADEVLSSTVPSAGWRAVDRSRWCGLSDRAAGPALLVDDEVGACLPDGPLDRRCAPRTIAAGDDDQSLWSLQRSALLAQCGIFNPMGPTVRTLEVLRDPVAGRRYLAERTHHPFSPRLDVHAVMDEVGDHRDAVLRDLVLSRLAEWADEFGAIHWFEIGEPTIADALIAGLRSFAEAGSFDLDRATRAAMASIGSPWRGLDAAVVASVRLPVIAADNGLDLVDLWVETVTDARVVDSHVAHLRSAWEGARVWRHDPSAANDVVRMIGAELHQRESSR